MKKVIFTLTSVKQLPDKMHSESCLRGIFLKEKDALHCVYNDPMDMSDAGNYPYLVLQEIQTGLLFPSNEETWFKRMGYSDWTPCSRPKDLNPNAFMFGQG